MLDSVDREAEARLLAGLDDVDWSAFQHAYGPATTTPAYIRSLLGDQPTRAQGFDHLWWAVTHQGTVWPAAAPTLPYLVRFLGDPAARPMLADLLEILEEMAAGAYRHRTRIELEADGASGIDWVSRLDSAPPYFGECRREAVTALDEVVSLLDDGDEDVRWRATSTALTIACLPEAKPESRAHALAVLSKVATADGSDQVRAAAVVSVAALGGGARRWLSDPSPAVRFAAALSLELADDEDGQGILIAGLAQPDAFDAAFSRKLPQYQWKPSVTAFHAVCRRVADRERALPALLAAVPRASIWLQDIVLGPALKYLFPVPDSGGQLSHPQRAFLDALVARDELWGSGSGNAMLCFRAVGLPYGREALRRRLRSNRAVR